MLLHVFNVFIGQRIIVLHYYFALYLISSCLLCERITFQSGDVDCDVITLLPLLIRWCSHSGHAHEAKP